MKGVIVHPIVLEHLCVNLQNLTQMTFIQLVKFHFVLMLVMTKGLQLMASTLGSAFQKEDVGLRISPLASSLPQVLLMEDLVLKNSSKIHEYEGREFIQHELFQAYPRGRDARCWSNLEAFRSIKSQSTTKIFVAPNHTVNAHNALVTWSTMAFKLNM